MVCGVCTIEHGSNDVEEGSGQPDPATLPDAPAWLTGTQADDNFSEEGSNFEAPTREASEAPRHQPAWSKPGAASAPSRPPPRQVSSSRDHFTSYEPSQNTRSSSGEGVGACCRKTFCSFRTMLVPCLTATFAVSLYTFVIRLVLNCSWEIGWTEFVSLLQVFVSGALVYGVVAGKSWLCAGLMGALLFALCSAVLSLTEGLGNDCDRNGEANEGGVPVPWWTLPSANALGCVLWLVCAKMLHRGMHEDKPSDNDARERKAPLLRNQ